MERCDQWPAAHGLATTHDDDRASIASRCSGPASNMSLASHPATARFYRHSGDAGHRHLIATPILNHRATSSRGIESSATAGTGTPQVAGHRINHPEASRDFAAARAQTVGAAPQTPSTIRRTRWRLRRLHTSQADYPCRKRQSRLRTLAISSSPPWDYPHHWASSRVHCIDWFHLRIIRAQGYRTAGPIHFVGLR